MRDITGYITTMRTLDYKITPINLTDYFSIGDAVLLLLQFEHFQQI